MTLNLAVLNVHMRYTWRTVVSVMPDADHIQHLDHGVLTHEKDHFAGNNCI